MRRTHAKVIAGHYQFELPDKWEGRYEEDDTGVRGDSYILRSWLVQRGKRTLSIYLDERLNPEDLADLVESQARKNPRPDRIMINGIEGTHVAVFVEGWGRMEYWLKRGPEMICFCIQGPDIKSRRDALDMEEVVKSVRFVGE